MIETNLNIDAKAELKDAADKLMDAAMDYWSAYKRVTGGAAVVWVKDSDGRLVILTRGEYREALLQNVDRLHSAQDVIDFD
jgi:hypothetical protein